MWHSSSVTMQAEKQKGQRKQQFVSRTIFHPSFKNVSMPDAISFLDTQNETISWVIRPSNKGTQQLSITMKVRICSTRVHRACLHDTYTDCIACCLSFIDVAYAAVTCYNDMPLEKDSLQNMCFLCSADCPFPGACHCGMSLWHVQQQ